VIDRLRDERFAHLMLVVGEGANAKVKDFAALLEKAGELRPRVRAGSLVAGRRWTVKLTNGIDVKLPEEGAGAALERLVKLQREHRLLERDIMMIDLRESDRVTVRLTAEAAEARRETGRKKLGKWKGLDA
jgi:cell division protein FtsQ